MVEGGSAAPISPTTTDTVKGLHSTPRPLTTTTPSCSPRLQILRNRPGSVEIAFFSRLRGACLRTTLFPLVFRCVCVGEAVLEGDRRCQGVGYPWIFCVVAVALIGGHGEEAHQDGTHGWKRHG